MNCTWCHWPTCPIFCLAVLFSEFRGSSTIYSTPIFYGASPYQTDSFETDIKLLVVCIVLQYYYSCTAVETSYVPCIGENSYYVVQYQARPLPSTVYRLISYQVQLYRVFQSPSVLTVVYKSTVLCRSNKVAGLWSIGVVSNANLKMCT